MPELLEFFFDGVTVLGMLVFGAVFFILAMLFIIGVAVRILQSGTSLLTFLARKIKLVGFDDDTGGEEDGESDKEIRDDRESEDDKEWEHFLEGLLDELIEDVYQHSRTNSALYEKAVNTQLRKLQKEHER